MKHFLLAGFLALLLWGCETATLPAPSTPAAQTSPRYFEPCALDLARLLPPELRQSI